MLLCVSCRQVAVWLCSAVMFLDGMIGVRIVSLVQWVREWGVVV